MKGYDIKDQMNLRSGGPERMVQKGSEHRVNKRNLSSNDSNSLLPRLRKKNRREETTQQGEPVRSRKGRERNDSPFIKERTRSSNKNARRGGDQQRQD
ncbi:hypothetical protein TNCV_3883791 [Trichonephila clavipes]|nr:hypothetical protein TNCV_3883791 [Trichonephila clavipes]